MKNFSFSQPILVVRFWLTKLGIMIFHPLGNLPAADFNNIYDGSIL